MSATLRTEPIFDALKAPLALIEGDERRRAIEAYLEAARGPVERAVFDALAEVVAAIDEQVAERYRVRLAYRREGLAVEVEPVAAAEGGEEAAFSSLEGDVEKITIRIPAELKDLAQQAATRAGTSANTWFVKALARAVRNIDIQTAPPTTPRPRERWAGEGERRHGRGSRFTGWVGGDDDE